MEWQFFQKLLKWISYGKKLFKNKKLPKQSRQVGFEDQTTTDDHLMHIVGMATDQTGAKYFVIKNSWGTGNKYGGIQYVSMPYFKSKNNIGYAS